MIKEELYIIKDGEKYNLDLPTPSGITLKWVSNLFSDISKLTCSYSYTFKLPMTANNRRVLDVVDDIRRDSLIAKKSIQAEFYINGVCLCPNANLYVSEINSAYSCVMTWRVLKAFEKLKSDNGKLTELQSLGHITWGKDEVYGGTDDATSNMDSVVYPDYDAGVPHESGTPPKPCVPIYKIIQMINEKYGVMFNIGKYISQGMGKKPNSYLNNASYYKKRVYDDYVSNGVIPLVNSTINGSKFAVRGINGIGNFTYKAKTLKFMQKWQVARFTLSGGAWSLFHYGIIEGTYTSLMQQNSEQLQAEYEKPKVIAVAIATFEEFRGNQYVKPVFGYLHDTGLSYYTCVKGERAEIRRKIDEFGAKATWGTRTYEGEEYIGLELSTDSGRLKEMRSEFTCTEDSLHFNVLSYRYKDNGYKLGVVGFYTKCAFTLKGSCELHIAKEAVDEGRIDISGYMWICLAKKSSDDEELDIVTKKDIASYSGFQSLDIPIFEVSSNSYVCHFDFGKTYDARKISIDADDDETLQAYMLLPYIPDDHMIDVTIPAEEGKTETTEKILNIEEGDIYISGLYVSELAPQVEVSSLPANLQITKCLPDISCFDFMKSVFYMNGAIPRVEHDGETISAAYYNMLRDRINDGHVMDWSNKLVAGNGQMPSSIKFHNTNFARTNYFEMAKSIVDSTKEELAEELDVYGNGYGSLTIDDDNLDASTTIFTSCFYPAYTKNMRFPLVKTGDTCKVWEGDKTLVEDVNPIYGVMVYRTLDPNIENANVARPGLSDITTYHKRMNVFSPFDDKKMMSKFFGYYQSILNDYRLVKEKVFLNEFDLRDFDESMPVYLSKYNAYFAVSTIQRDKSGMCTVEFVKLPKVDDSLDNINDDYEVELMLSGYLEVDAGAYDTSKIYCKKTENGEWEELTDRRLSILNNEYYAITADNDATNDPALRIILSYVGQYKYTYTDSDTGERKSIIRNEGSAYYDGIEWNDNSKKVIYEGDEDWHKVEIVIPIRNQYGEIIETRRWRSPLFTSNKTIADYGVEEIRTHVSVGREMLLTLRLERTYTSNPCPILADGGELGGNRNELYAIGHKPTYAQPDLEGANYMKGDSYRLNYSVYKSVGYTVTKRKGFDIISQKKYTAKLRTYYDDTRITEDATIAFVKSEFGQHHTFKFIADLIDDNGNIVKKLRHRMVWFVYGIDKSVIDTPFGDEHNGDASVKVKDVTISGADSIADKEPHPYTLSFLPAYADIKAKSVGVSVVERALSLSVSNVSTGGFTLTANELPESETTATIMVETTLEDGSTFTKEKVLSVLRPSLYISTEDIDVIDGSGSATFSVHVRPADDGGVIKDVKTTHDNVKAAIKSNKLFEVSATNVTEGMNEDITVTVEYKGMMITGATTVKINASVNRLDYYGALIVDRNGNYYTEDEWLNSGLENNDADGVAVSDKTHRFILSKKNLSGFGVWGASGTLIEGVVTSDDALVAQQDFAGKMNTDVIAKALPDSFAAKLAGRNDFPSGKTGYCAALGEWNVIGGKRSYINQLLNTIGADELFYNSNACDYFTTTQYNAYRSWTAHFGANVELTMGYKDSEYFMRPLAEISEGMHPTPIGNMEIVGGESFKATNGSGSVEYSIKYSPEGVSIAEVSVASNNPAVVATKVSDVKFNLSVSGIIVDEVAIITVRARLNNMMHRVTKTITVVGEVVVDYDKLDNANALILCKDYTLYTEDEWIMSKRTKSDVEGIAVSDGTHRVIMAINDAGRYYYGGRNISIDGLSTDIKAYNGKSNTEAIVKRLTGSDGYFTSEPYSAAAVAKNFLFPTGKAGFLPSYAEWELVDKYYDKVDALLTAVGGDALIKDFSFTYWASTTQDNLRGYCYHCYKSSSDGSINHDTGGYIYRSDTSLVRPFRNF